MVGKFGGDFNLVIWRCREKTPNPILNPIPAGHSGMHAVHISNVRTHIWCTIMALYQYFKKDSCIFPRECDIGDSSLSGKELRA